MSHGPENIYFARWCHFCDCGLAPSVANLHGLASCDRRLDSANVGKLDCSRRSGWLELLRIKPHAASAMTKPTKEQKNHFAQHQFIGGCCPKGVNICRNHMSASRPFRSQ